MTHCEEITWNEWTGPPGERVKITKRCKVELKIDLARLALLLGVAAASNKEDRKSARLSGSIVCHLVEKPHAD